MGTVTDPRQPRIEFTDHITEVLNRLGGQDKIMFANLPSEQTRLRQYMQECLDEDWLKLRGIVVETVAIGGITLENAHELKDTGIAGFSVVSAIMSAENPKEASEKLREIFNSQ
jgi:nicotinate-nucleotide pyrophosphorylase